LRRQIEELRSQLARYAEALEDDLAQGREKVTAKTREGLMLEKNFAEASDALLKQLRGRPECRDLFEELARKHASDD
jgi:serine/threonine-protein kinase